MAPRLELRDIVVRRGGRVVLRVERLEIERGEVLAVVGPNGAGKSTLLQVAALLLRADAGHLLIDGLEAAGDALAVRRRMAVAMQDALLLGGSVLDNVALGLKLRGIAKGERDARARAWLQRFGIESLASRQARKLSGGEAQRASLARAFALDPDILFLDEPFAGLDEPTRAALLDDVGAVLRQTETTTLFVTHDRDEALHLAGRVAVVLDGRLRQVGAPQEVFGAPVDEDVAAFIGVENILPGRLVAAGGGVATVDVAGRALVGLEVPGLRGEVRVCLRPEAIVLQAASEAPVSGSARNLLSGIVVEVRPRGAEARVVVDCGFPLVALVTRLSAEDLRLAPGVPVVASFKATAVHFLPGSDGRPRVQQPS